MRPLKFWFQTFILVDNPLNFKRADRFLAGRFQADKFYDAEFQHSYPDRNGFGFTYGTSGTWKYANWQRVE